MKYEPLPQNQAIPGGMDVRGEFGGEVGVAREEMRQVGDVRLAGANLFEKIQCFVQGKMRVMRGPLHAVCRNVVEPLELFEFAVFQ